MRGVSAITGKAIEGDAHLAQSVRDILTTPLGSRIGRREYGSELMALIDAPVTPSTRLRLFAATALALLRWEPRLRLSGMALSPGGAAGTFLLTLDGQRTDQLPAATHLTVSIATSA